MSGRGSLANQTPNAVWSDGIHFVRPASHMDDHPLRWVVGAHRTTGSKVKRRMGTFEEALLSAVHATTTWLKSHPTDKVHFEPPTVSPTSSIQLSQLPKAYRVLPAERAAPPPKFATTHFNCIRANPIAQVWQCVSIPGERAPVGRKRAGGKAPKQATFQHSKGECAVMLWREPVREEDGQVRVFPSWQVAEDHALNLYYGADEEERTTWREDDQVVARTANVDIVFDPAVNGVKRPFSLWVPKYNKPVYTGYRKKRYAKAGGLLTGGTFMPGNTDEAAALDFARKLAEMDDDSDNRVLTDEIATFESIWGAEDHALNVTERVLRGESVIV